MTSVRRAALGAWLALLLLPNLSTVPLAGAWDGPRWQLVAVSLWMAVCAWAVVPRRLFLVLTYPLVVAGLAIVGADFLRSANLLELLAVAYTFREAEIRNVVAPYVGAAALVAAVMLALLVYLWRGERGEPMRRGFAAGVVLFGLLMVVVLPARSWRDAWPAALASAVLEGQAGSGGIDLPSLANVSASPRNRFESWQAHREHGPGYAETYVLVIGESVRSDRVPGCGGRPQVAPPPDGSLLYCDVVSGSSSTHTSVPLLVSRDLPGSRERVSRDATMLKAFEAAGFETFWLAVQERLIAWPDAQNQAYHPAPGLDRDVLLPLLDKALATPVPRKLIVLHAYNAHSPYRDRYRAATAPFPVDALDGATWRPRAQTGGDARWNDYDNAIDESMRFLREIADRLRSQQGAAFMVFTPDHGENMRDDARNLTDHALKLPTLWDTRVPAVFWANGTWREANPDRWLMLSRNVAAPLMHMDLVPTMLGAADIRYTERRAEPVDMTARIAPPRARFTQVRAGEIVTLDELRRQAQPR